MDRVQKKSTVGKVSIQKPVQYKQDQLIIGYLVAIYIVPKRVYQLNLVTPTRH